MPPADSIQLNSGPCQGVIAITPGVPYSAVVRSLFVQNAGTLAMVFTDGSVATITVGAQVIMPFCPISIEAGSTASGILGLL